MCIRDSTYTENGAVTYCSTQSACLDLFATVGALRRAPADEITGRFCQAYAEDADLAMKTLFYARDIRGGLGERRVFRTLLQWLASYAPQSVEKNLPYIAEYGRYDDLLSLLDTACAPAALQQIKTQFTTDMAALHTDQPVSLLGKWLPSVNASNGQTVQQAKRIARFLGLNDAAYRKALSALRQKICILENNLRQKDYTFDYAKQPALALFKYRQAFLRNDGPRYADMLAQVAAGTQQLHTGTLTPYEIIQPFFSRNSLTAQERQAIDATWASQADFAGDENALVVIDGSGSMYGGSKPVPATVALSLGIYYAERNTGKFKNHFITFSANPRLVEIKGRDLFEKVQYCSRFNEVANTNLQRVFDLILNTAVQHQLPQSEMPAKLYIISDMEFDACVDGGSMTNFECAQARFTQYGYALPQVIFWNVASRNRQQPVQRNQQGVALVSGCSPRIFSMVQTGVLTPYAWMMEVLGAPRYEAIVA